MAIAQDLNAETVAAALPGRPVRFYPALLSTQADALAWARAGAPDGALVVAEYQASPRGRAGLEWRVRAGEDLGFSLILRPRLPAHREGWLFTVAASGLADAVGPHVSIEWPDEVRTTGVRRGAVGVDVEFEADRTTWAVVSVHVADVALPRATVLARLVEAIEARYRSPTAPVLADYLRRCETIGKSVRARMVPLGPGGPEITGKAVSSLADGALVIQTAAERRIAVRPQKLARLEVSS